MQEPNIDCSFITWIKNTDDFITQHSATTSTNAYHLGADDKIHYSGALYKACHSR